MSPHSNQNPAHNVYQPLEHSGRTYEQFRSRYAPIAVPGPDGEWVPVRRDPAVTTTSYQHPNHRAPPSLQRQNAQEGIFSDHYGPSIAGYQERRDLLQTYVPQRRESVEYEYVPARAVSPYEEIDIHEDQHLRDTGEEAWVDLGIESHTGNRQESGQRGGPTSSSYQNVPPDLCHVRLRNLGDQDLVFPEERHHQYREHVFHAPHRPAARNENRHYLQGGDRQLRYQLSASQQVRPRLHHNFRPHRQIYELPRHHSTGNEYSGPRERPSVPLQARRARNPYNATVEDETPEHNTADATNPTTTEAKVRSPEEIAQLMEELRLRAIMFPRKPSPSPTDSVKYASEVAQGPNSDLANETDGRGVEANDEQILAHSPFSPEREQDAYSDSAVGEVHANSPADQEDPEHGELFEDAQEVALPENPQLNFSVSAPEQPRFPSCECCFENRLLRVRISNLEEERKEYERQMVDLIRWRYDPDVRDVNIEGNIGGPRTTNKAPQEPLQTDLRPVQYDSPDRPNLNHETPPQENLHRPTLTPDPTPLLYVQVPPHSPPITHPSQRPSFPPPSVGNRTTMRRLIVHAQTEGTCTPDDVERWLGAEYLLGAGEIHPRVALDLVQEDMEGRSGGRIRIRRREGDRRRGV